jgi:hypothetical protein
MQIYNILIYYHQHIINGKEFYNSLPSRLIYISNAHIYIPLFINILYIIILNNSLRG